MSNKINILYFKMRKTEDSLLNQIIFSKIIGNTLLKSIPLFL